ncbi:3-hydroxyacyl-CoA dehydrogenase [Roseibium aestuarii]|uniref:L-gulonate 3-dehydrogenase n=1 Tax=Roseibium aestuarii TaxID=2600299 RepID=A0ABW4JU34_9HYPH|nr:3-hydroxyacyl-CoA dehydrogenase [Roseibium aestuarii]
MAKIAIVGSGFIGRAWAITFARGGYDVALWDPVEGAAEAAITYIGDVLGDLEANDLLNGHAPAAILARLTPCATLAQVLDGASYAQENAPERLKLKQALWSEMDAAASPGTILASSTSALLPSRFTEHLEGRGRCLVAHPINPPYLIRAVEVVPSPWTSPEAMERTGALMREVGQLPIMMTGEIDGFIMNRLQGALLEEAFRLVAGGHASAEDVDIGIREGLAARWAFMGPFETIDLNAPGGVRDYAQRYQGMFANMSSQMLARVDWDGPVMDRVEADRRARLPESGLVDRQKWRDRRLMALAAHKRAQEKELGE